MKALVALADGTVFEGRALGRGGECLGEMVFNTSMTGYQEILTDPSYAGQIVTMTYPLIGNYGVTPEDDESARPQVRGFLMKECSRLPSSWRARQSLPEYLEEHGVLGIEGIDTRELTRRVRIEGVMDAAISTTDLDPDSLVEKARAWPGLVGVDMVAAVSCSAPYVESPEAPRFHVVALDYGIKRNILRKLADAGCRVSVLPAATSAEEVLALGVDGVFLSNGPGDPEPCDYAIGAIRTLVGSGLPTFGICLGHQLLALASGAQTVKMKFGHHGANHPVVDLASGRVMITSQNHGFAVDEDTLPANLRATHRSLFDGSLQGIERLDRPAFSFQGHPEASPGPHDVDPLFARFIRSMSERRER